MYKNLEKSSIQFSSSSSSCKIERCAIKLHSYWSTLQSNSAGETIVVDISAGSAHSFITYYSIVTHRDQGVPPVICLVSKLHQSIIHTYNLRSLVIIVLLLMMCAHRCVAALAKCVQTFDTSFYFFPPTPHFITFNWEQ